VEEDLAFEEALLIEADAGRGRPVLRFWEASEYTVVLGASCRIQEDVLQDACRADGVRILRRSSGGGTVLVGPGALCVSMILPESAGPSLSTIDGAYHYVLESLAASIRSAGAAVDVAGRGDLVLRGRKCGGSAQRRLKHWFMVHCSILYDFAIERVVRYLAIPRKQPEYRAGRAHQEFLINLGLPRHTLVDAIRTHCACGSSLAPAPVLAAPFLQSLVSEKFSNPAWIERF
jgi:lipoate-protein ligase A